MGMIRLLRRLFWLGLAVLALTAAAVQWRSLANLREHGAWRASEPPVDAVLVLGGGVDGDGMIGYSSRRRTAVAAELVKLGLARHAILSGAPPMPGTPPTAELMRRHAVALGAPEAALIVEPDAVSTFENLRFGFAIARARGFARLAIVTDAFHVERARRLADYLGRQDAAMVAVDGMGYEGPGNRVWGILREALAWWLNLGKVAGWEALAMAGMDSRERQELIR